MRSKQPGYLPSLSLFYITSLDMIDDDLILESRLPKVGSWVLGFLGSLGIGSQNTQRAS